MQFRGQRPMSGSNFKTFSRILEGKIPTGTYFADHNAILKKLFSFIRVPLLLK